MKNINKVLIALSLLIGMQQSNCAEGGRFGRPGAAGLGRPGAPGVGAPGVGAPGVGAPGVGAPGVGAPGVGAPGVGGGIEALRARIMAAKAAGADPVANAATPLVGAN